MTLSDLINMMRERGTSAPDAVLRALEEIDRRLTAIEGRDDETPPDGPPCSARWQLGGRLADQRCMLRGPHTQHQTAEVDGLTGEWSDPDRGEIVPRDEPSPPPLDLLQLADEAIEACADAKERSTFSVWEVAGEKVRAYREARRTGAVKASSSCCATMRDRAVEAIEREIASVQKIRRLSGEERMTAVEFLTYAANHVRALEVK